MYPLGVCGFLLLTFSFLLLPRCISGTLSRCFGTSRSRENRFSLTTFCYRVLLFHNLKVFWVSFTLLGWVSRTSSLAALWLTHVSCLASFHTRLDCYSNTPVFGWFKTKISVILHTLFSYRIFISYLFNYTFSNIIISAITA